MAPSFGFWSKNEGQLLAKSCSDLTLETSGVGAVFDQIPTLDAKKFGWDPELWGGLSKAYATAVGNEAIKGKRVHVWRGRDARQHLGECREHRIG